MAGEPLTFEMLLQFHREIVLPDIARLIDARLHARLVPFEREVHSHFDAIYGRFDRLESEFQSLRAAYAASGTDTRPS
jgi:hypothetical protein